MKKLTRSEAKTFFALITNETSQTPQPNTMGHFFDEQTQEWTVFIHDQMNNMICSRKTEHEAVACLDDNYHSWQMYGHTQDLEP